MIEKVNPKHPDKIADRIAGAIVDLAYKKEKEPKIAVEILIGHGNCMVIIESNQIFTDEEIEKIVYRICETKDIEVKVILVKQDEHLASNQENKIKSGDNGIFKGMPLTSEEKEISKIARELYFNFPSDGKYILNDKKFICCQSNATNEQINKVLEKYDLDLTINPLGEWTGGINVDTGATNRKLGSDMGHSVTGGGLHGKDLSKADVSINIYAHIKAQKTGKPVELFCAIGDEKIDGKDYDQIVKIAKEYIEKIGGFENLATWRLY